MQVIQTSFIRWVFNEFWLTATLFRSTEIFSSLKLIVTVLSSWWSPSFILFPILQSLDQAFGDCFPTSTSRWSFNGVWVFVLFSSNCFSVDPWFFYWTLLSILSDLSNAVVRWISTCPLIPMSSCSLTNSLGIDPCTPIIIGITVSFMFVDVF